MDLKTQLLRALQTGALFGVTITPIAACSTDDTTDDGETPPWQVNNTSPDQSLPDQSLPDQSLPDQSMPDQGLPDQGEPDMPPGSECFPSGVDAPTPLEPDGWWTQSYDSKYYNVDDSDRKKTYVVCFEQSRVMECEQAAQLTNEDVTSMLQQTLERGPDSCSTGEPDTYSYVPGSICGPVYLRNAPVCCYAMKLNFYFSCVEGRPLQIEGVARLAAVTERSGWSSAVSLAEIDALPEALRLEAARAWAEAGSHEHASVASFARFVMELMSLGAPLALVQGATQAMEDEIHHARHCFSLASAYLGRELGPEGLNVRGSLDHIADEAQIMRAAILEGCIGETLSASVAGWRAARAKDARTKEILSLIAEEEGRHAELNWAFVQWMLHTRPHLREVARATFEEALVASRGEERWASGVSDEERVLWDHGVTRAVTEERLRARAFHEIVLPCQRALLAVAGSMEGDGVSA